MLKDVLRAIRYVFYLLCLLLIFMFFTFNYCDSAVGDGNLTYQLTVTPEDSWSDVANQLSDNEIVRNSLFLELLASLLDSETLQPGEYLLDDGQRNWEIVHYLALKDNTEITLDVKPGMSLYQIAELVDEKGLGTKEEFITTCSDEEIIKKYNIPAATLEGFLFPDTYIFYPGATVQSVVEEMLRHFFKAFPLNDVDFVNRLAALKFESFYDWVILASLIEPVAQLDYEKELISAVFYNRLQNGMMLESEAALRYALSNSADGDAGGAELQLPEDKRLYDTPYNTFTTNGLPPSPICNPGYLTLIAAFSPVDRNYLYFTPKDNRAHYFAFTQEENQLNQEKYQRWVEEHEILTAARTDEEDEK